MHLLLILMTSLITPAAAEPVDTAVWAAAAMNQPITGRLRLWTDLHARRDGGAFVGIVRPGLGLDLSDRWNAWAGVAYVPFVPDDGDIRHEIRVWQQLIGTVSLGERASLMTRTRFEQRTASGGGAGYRVRQFVRIGGVTQQAGRISPVVWDEVFVGLNDTSWGAVAGLDQNRLFGGIAIPAGRGRFELGVLYAAVFRDEVSSTLALSTTWFVPRFGD
jgi:hypothetical protein